MKCDKKNLLLYAVTDRHWLNGRQPALDVVKESLDGGVTIVQLREKNLEEAHFLEEARELQTPVPAAITFPLSSMTTWTSPLAMDADGVHVGQSDMEALDVRGQVRTGQDHRRLRPDGGAGPAWPSSTERTIWASELYSRPDQRMMPRKSLTTP